jgi:hypothetical protein
VPGLRRAERAVLTRVRKFLTGCAWTLTLGICVSRGVCGSGLGRSGDVQTRRGTFSRLAALAEIAPWCRTVHTTSRVEELWAHGASGCLEAASSRLRSIGQPRGLHVSACPSAHLSGTCIPSSITLR